MSSWIEGYFCHDSSERVSGLRAVATAHSPEARTASERALPNPWLLPVTERQTVT